MVLLSVVIYDERRSSSQHGTKAVKGGPPRRVYPARISNGGRGEVAVESSRFATYFLRRRRMEYVIFMCDGVNCTQSERLKIAF